MKRFTVHLAFLALLLLSVTVHAQGHMHGRWAAAPDGAGMSGQHAAKLAAALNLTADQTASLQKLQQDQQAKMQPIFAQSRQLHQQLEQALAGDNPDPAAVGQLVISAHGLRAQMKAAHQEFETAFTALLTPDQAAKFAQIKASHGPGAWGHGSKQQQ
jgi:Spy/CpxP family protein refolding chaperone